MDDLGKSYRLSRLYFKLLHKTDLEKKGWTMEKLAEEMQRNGFIKIVVFEGDKRFVETEGVRITKHKLTELVEGGIMKLSIVLVVMLGVMGCATSNPYKLERTLAQYEAEAPVGRTTSPAHKAEADGTMNLYDRYSHQCYSEVQTDLWGRPYKIYTDCD